MRVFYDSHFKRKIDPIVLVGNEEARQECRFVLVETHKRLTFIAVLTVHAETSILFIYFPTIYASQ